MISKQKTTLKEYRNSKGREKLLHPKPRERMQGGKKVRRTTPPPTPMTLTQAKIQTLLEKVWLRALENKIQRCTVDQSCWAESCQPGCQLSGADKQKTPTGYRAAR